MTELDAFSAALREAGHGPEVLADPVVERTRRRIMSSLGGRPDRRRRRLAFAVFALALSTATLSWAATSGHLAQLLERLHITSAPPPPAIEPPRPLRRAFSSARSLPPPPPAPVPAVAEEPPAPLPVAAVESRPERQRGPQTRPAQRSRRSARPDPVATGDADLATYRHAHRAHFHGSDPAAALVAWDAYLVAYPAGRFAAEAAYNRAIALIRLGRTDDARAALAPFAEGEVADGYRRAEATGLREALAR